MGDPIEFASNYSDQSTQHGFQFEFHCDRCQSGFLTTFKPFPKFCADCGYKVG